MNHEIDSKYAIAVQTIKSAILQSQYMAIKLVNKEQLALYYGIGRYISQNSRQGYWGTAAIKVISMRLQAELPGLRGFSERNLKNMRTFYEEWQALDSNSAVVTAELQTTELQGDIPLIIPDKPNSQHQKYRLIAKGLQLKELLEKNK